MKIASCLDPPATGESLCGPLPASVDKFVQRDQVARMQTSSDAVTLQRPVPHGALTPAALQRAVQASIAEPRESESATFHQMATPADHLPAGGFNPPAFSLIGPIQNRHQARVWALVLQSQRIGFMMQWSDQGQGPAGWSLRIAHNDLPRAEDAIDLYEEENQNWPPVREKDTPRHQISMLLPLAFVSALFFYQYVTGPVAGGSGWFQQGRADARLLFAEPWRMITALTLHADGQHVLGNTISGSIFGAMLSSRIGGGGALLAIVFAGGLGNALNALHHLPGGHRSIGASTAVFAAVGMLAAVQTIVDIGRRKREAERGAPRRGWRDVPITNILAPIIGGLALLGALGAGGGNTDVWAHGFGFLAGVGIGGVSGLLVVRKDSKPSLVVQALCFAAAGGLVLGSWALALM